MTPTNDERLTAIIDTLRAIQPTPLAETRVLCAGRVDEDAAWLREHGYLVEAIDADGVHAQLITPPGPLDQGILVAFHGGGFIVCSAATHAKAFGLMGAASRLRVLNVDYRLAPEHRFPAAHDDCLRATRWAARALHRDVVLIGDSVGGNLSLSVGAQLIGEADVTVRGIVSISPLTDFTLSSPSLTTRRARDPFTYCAGLPELRQMYLGDNEALARDPRASPLFADVRGLAPTLVQMGSEEICYDDGLRMAERIHAAGGRVRFEEWQGMFHTWHHYAGTLSGADEAIEAVGEWVRDRIGGRQDLDGDEYYFMLARGACREVFNR